MKRISRLMLMLGAVALLALGCNRDNTSTQGGGALSGSVNADGSSTVFPVTQAIAEEWQAEAPEVEVAVGTSGTGGGFEKFCAGETDISNASRPIKDEEKDICTTNGVEYVELTVAIDGLSVLVNPANSWAKCLTVDELKKIWEPNSSITNWKDVKEGFPDRPLTKAELYGPGTDSGTFDYFTAEIVGEEGASRSDYTPSENDNDLVKGIVGNDNALGYFGFAYYEQNKESLRTVQVDGGDGCVTPNRETINSGEYKPLSRPLFIYVAKKAAAREEVKAFIDFYLESVNDLIADVGYIAMPDDMLGKSKSDWESFV